MVGYPQINHAPVSVGISYRKVGIEELRIHSWLGPLMSFLSHQLA